MAMSPDTSGQPTGPWSASVLEYPAGTTIRLSLLVAVVLTAGVFVGDWLYLGSANGSPQTVAPAGWLLVPPLLALGALLFLVVINPAILERRNRLVRVPSDVGQVAHQRLKRLSSRAELEVPPRLMWNPEAAGGAARVYGLPGNYRIAIAPALIGAARRRPEVFDTVLRHELAHIRNHDVVPLVAARNSGFVVSVLLAAPVVWRVVDHDLSLLPDFLWRAALIVVLVRGIRTAVLRSREHYADVRAASWSDEPLQITEVLTAYRRQTRDPAPRSLPVNWFSLHPDVGQRTAIVRNPQLLGRPGIGEMLALGLLPAASQPLVEELLVALGQSSQTADRISHAVVYAALGAGVAAVALRSVGTHTLGYRALVASVLALALGAGTGAVMSLAGTGLLSLPTGVSGGPLSRESSYVLVIEILTCFVAGCTVLILFADGLRLRFAGADTRPSKAPTILLGVLASALAAAAALPAIKSVVPSIAFPLHEELLYATEDDGATIALGLLVVVSALVVLLKSRSPATVGVASLIGLIAGAAATVGSVTLRLAMLPLSDDETIWNFYLGSIWIAVTVAAFASIVTSVVSPEGTMAGMLVAFVTCVTATVGFIIELKAVGSSADRETVLTTAQYIGNTVMLTGLPLAALAAALSGSATRRTEQTQRWHFSDHLPVIRRKQRQAL